MKPTPTQRLLRHQQVALAANVRILGESLKAETPDWAAVLSDLAAITSAVEAMRERAEIASQ